MVRETIRNTIEKHELIKPGDHVIVGLSGGPDSVCLFHVLLSLADEMNLKIEATHINHKFRPGDAEEDQAYVEELCKELDVPCSSYEYDCIKIAREHKLTEEEAGRKARYMAFERSARTLQKSGVSPEKIKIAVAQNKNDQAETVLFRIMRGTGVDGLGAMEYKRKGRHNTLVIRPLLDVERRDIESYCRLNRLKPRKDKTNAQSIYARNKIRLELIPYIEKNFNDNVIDKLVSLSDNAREDSAYLSSVTEENFRRLTISENFNECVLDRQGLLELPVAIRHRVMMRALATIGLYKDVGYNHIMICDALLRDGKGESGVDLPRGYYLQVSYDKAIFRIDLDEDRKSALKKEPVLITQLVDAKDYEPREGLAAFDYDMLMQEHTEFGEALNLIALRTRMPGDFIRPAGMDGRKKIQDIMVDEKVPKEKREEIFMIAVGNEILYIPGGEMRAIYSENYKINDETKRVITLEIKG